ncbi:MAG: Na(+)-translocating NADH-quinone reductase subunit A [Bacteroidia bacterium]|nr:Na(+)-translocating NADH-quinone reductase subunit A [Bacteroidia bacterium]|tara:strand:+ start:3917 stop:5266 length:1350 start_codon:yes stop_codon:yes gene_type:complete
MGKNVKIKRGMDIPLEGKPSTHIHAISSSTTFAIKPTDFKGLIPKLRIKQGEEVSVGDCLFTDKKNDKICFTSPVSGEVAEIVRGDRRAITAIKILADSSEYKFKEFDIQNYPSKNVDEIKAILLESGLWPFITQRPYGVIADTEVTPKSIHVSGFDSSPLAADLGVSLRGQESQLETGFKILNMLSEGGVYLNLHAKKDNTIYQNIKDVNVSYFDGPHPSGLVGVQINNLDPINKGDIVWTIKPQHVAFIGKLFETGKLDFEQNIVIAGSEVKEPAYYTTRLGASVDSLMNDNYKSENVRVISGNVLTGTKIDKDGYLGFFDNQVTVIPEGNQYELLGWLFPSYARPTLSPSLPISKYLKKSFNVNTNPHGEPRAYVVTGQYEKVLPMDIMPQQLIKAVMAKDLELMENLGIYEVIEEDMALCEFVCTSKINVQQVLSEGLELMAEES